MRIFVDKINVFTDKIVAGNPATVYLLDHGFLSTGVMQNIARENQSPETVFVVSNPPFDISPFKIRFFSSTQEIDICGHGMIAAAHSLWQQNRVSSDHLYFQNINHITTSITKIANTYHLALSRIAVMESTPPRELSVNFTRNFNKSYRASGRSWILLYKSYYDIIDLPYQPKTLTELGERSIIVSAPYGKNGYALRYFTPKENQTEDFVTGIAQTMIAPLWAQYWKTNVLDVIQLSSRGGTMVVTVEQDTITIAGQVVTCSSNVIHL